MGGDYMSDLIYLKGVGPKTLSLLNKLEINDIDDLVTHYPYKYEVLKRSDVSSLNQDDKIIIDGIVENVPIVYRFKSIDKMQFNINIGSNIYKVIIFNRGFMKTNINIGSQIIAIGKFDKKNNTIVASEILLNENLNNIKIIPFYRTCDGLNRKTLKKIINTALTNYNPVDFIPDYITLNNSFIDKKSALNNIHNPSNIEMVKKSLLRLKYEELFMFMLKINALR